MTDGLRQYTFGAGLKGVKLADVERVEALVLETLEAVTKSGFSPDHVASSFNTIEFALREFASGGGPRGLSLLLGNLHSWLYGRDPVGELRFEEPLANLKKTVEADPQYFQNLIRTHLLTNTHRVTVHMFPDPNYTRRRANAERAALDALHARLTPGDAATIAREAEELALHQSTPDAEKDLAKIPSLRVADLPVEARKIARTVSSFRPGHAAAVSGAAAAAGGGGGGSSTPAAAAAATTLLQHEQPTRGIGYATLYFDLSRIPQRLLPYVPLLSWCMTSTGTGKRDQVALNHAIGTHTGGIGASGSVLEVPGDRDAALPFFTVGGKVLKSKIPAFCDLLLETMTDARLDAAPRIAHYLRSTISGHESGLVSSGHRYGASLLSSLYTKPGWISDVWGGLTGLAAARRMQAVMPANANGDGNGNGTGIAYTSVGVGAVAAPRVAVTGTSSGSSRNTAPVSFDQLVADLHELRSLIINQEGALLVSTTSDGDTMAPLTEGLQGVVAALAGGPSAAAAAAAAGSHQHGPRSARSLFTQPQWAWGAADHHRAAGCWSLPTMLSATGNGYLEAPTQHIGIVVPTQVNYCVKMGIGYDLQPGYAYDNHHASASADGGHHKHHLPHWLHLSRGAGSTSSSSSPSSSSAAASKRSRRYVHGSSDVISSIVNTGYLWEKVRVQGGAYGGFSSLNR